uniref:Cytochrome P450, family 17, subfamily A, polypeptide 2 n=1 Tax=Hippocampus comes TaxID=109280 RepID=A0A3Q2Y0W8_HIPCM
MATYVFPVTVSPLLTVLLVLAALAILAALGQRSSGMPGLPRLPVVGSLPWMTGTTPPHLLFMKFGRKYGPLFELYLGPHRTVVVNDHDHAREVLLQRGRDFAGRPSMVMLRDPRDLLDALLKGQGSPGPDGTVITDDHVLMTAAEAFGAGVETTSTTLLWVLAYLLHHPEVEEKAQRELDEEVGERAVRAADRGRLPYLDSIINEGMRIRPVSPVLIPHIAMSDSSQVTRPSTPNRGSKSEPCHKTFPDRFLDDQGQRVTPSCFLPFGAGPRICVGESLARMELFLFLSSMLQRMSFMLPGGATPPNLQGRLGVVLQPLPYKVAVRPRAGWEVSTHVN